VNKQHENSFSLGLATSDIHYPEYDVGPQIYLQRRSSCGRATAGCQNVPRSHRKAEEILTTFIQPANVGSRHLEYIDDGVFLLSSGVTRGHLVCREMLLVRNDGDVWQLSEAPPAGGCPCNTLLWPSTFFSDGTGVWPTPSSGSVGDNSHNYSGKLRPRERNWRWDPVLVLLWQVMVPRDPVN